MKKLVSIILLSLFVVSAQAQNQQGQSEITAGIGYSVLMNAARAAINQGENITADYIPTLQLTYDYAISDLFSMGVALGYQKINSDFVYTYTNDDNIEITENASVDLSRVVVSVRPLIHYGGTDQLDLYSGLKVGIKSVSSDVSSTDPNLDLFDNRNRTGIALGVIPFGMRYHVTDNFGFHADLQIGAPYLVSAGIALKI